MTIKERSNPSKATKREVQQLSHIVVTDSSGKIVDLLEVLEKGPFTLTGLVQLEENEEPDPLIDSTIVLGHPIKISPIWTYSLKDDPVNKTTTVWILTPTKQYGVLGASKEYSSIYNTMVEKLRLFYIIKTKFKRDMMKGTLEDYNEYIVDIYRCLILKHKFEASFLVYKHIRFLISQMVGFSSSHVWEESPFFQRIRESNLHIINDVNEAIHKTRLKRKDSKAKVSSNIIKTELTLQAPSSISIDTRQFDKRLYISHRTTALFFPNNSKTVPGLRIVEPNNEADELWKTLQDVYSGCNTPWDIQSLSFWDWCNLMSTKFKETPLQTRVRIEGHAEALLYYMQSFPHWLSSYLFVSLKEFCGYSVNLQEARSLFRVKARSALRLAQTDRESMDGKVDATEEDVLKAQLWETLVKKAYFGLPSSDYMKDQYTKDIINCLKFTSMHAESALLNHIPYLVRRMNADNIYWCSLSIYHEFYNILETLYSESLPDIPSIWSKLVLNSHGIKPYTKKGRSHSSSSKNANSIVDTLLPENSTKVNSLLEKSKHYFHRQRNLPLLKKIRLVDIQKNSQVLWKCPVNTCTYYAVHKGTINDVNGILNHIYHHLGPNHKLNSRTKDTIRLIEFLDTLSGI
ncbi:Rik1-associated factor Raf2 [Schizosaccharomyces japonicus yFS275]|uniref:Rik1-associated factor Raf2 n=1 Tax=Schizosaccharomyces japonicus (strain yFS275 / FY16936) TaxID=402676 RepID=B6K1K8_SCHJY|nr:Rik1-associated factor Raf2 [Schizosaccharomyces japonicus yFS275]EEB07039.1 Rik1-associated factor Raf2 [Schizosaccharomyces japonicus yFS275]